MTAALAPWRLAVVWATVLGVALFTRPLLPVDETRYLSVAWEMWQRGDWLVPYLNGAPYSHKPPLLFWLFHLGWAVFGVEAWWPRMVPALVSLGCLALSARLARTLWPDIAAGAAAAWLLFGTLFWLAFYTLTQFDLLLVLWTLLGMLGILRAARGQASGWLLTGLAIGLGVLSKGPVILLHLLPVALLGPLWVERAQVRGWGRWYGGQAAALALGAAIALTWALPAAQAGGEAYREAIFWGQTANRMVASFAHRQPWWWYLPLVPLLLLPWTLWPTLWRAARRAPGLRFDRGARFLLAWTLPVLLAFSLVSGKQAKYLLPLLPAAALLGAWWLARGADPGRRERPRLAAALLLGGGVALALIGRLSVAGPDWLGAVPAWPGAVLAGLGAALWMGPALSWPGRLAWTSAAGAALVVALHLGVVRSAAPAYDLSPLSQRLHALQAEGVTLANVGKYHGQFHFLGRLHRPLVVLGQDQARPWAQAHPRDVLVVYLRGEGPVPDAALWLQPYRGGRLGLWRGVDFAARFGPDWYR